MGAIRRIWATGCRRERSATVSADAKMSVSRTSPVASLYAEATCWAHRSEPRAASPGAPARAVRRGAALGTATAAPFVVRCTGLRRVACRRGAKRNTTEQDAGHAGLQIADLTPLSTISARKTGSRIVGRASWATVAGVTAPSARSPMGRSGPQRLAHVVVARSACRQGRSSSIFVGAFV